MQTRTIAAILMSIIGLTTVADTETVGNIVWTYEKSGGVATISGAKTTAGTKVSGDIVIPETLGGASVENIGSSSGSYYSGVFYECTGIRSVVIPAGLKIIGGGTFNGCTGMKTITFGLNVGTLGSYSFYGCTGLQNVSLPSSVRTIGDCAFSRCSGLKTIYIPVGVTSIGSYAFSECKVLMLIDLPDSVVQIGEYAFAGCLAATTLRLPNGLTSIEDDTFRECASLTSVSIPDSVASIASGAFASCTELRNVTIGKNVVSIGDGAFGYVNFASGFSPVLWANCPNLNRVIFRGDAPTMAEHVFGYEWNEYNEEERLPSSCTAYVRRGSTGWGVSIPGTWQGIKIAYWNNTIVFPRTVTFNANGGTFVSGSSRCSVNEGNALGTLPEVTQPDYDFLGWYTQPENGERVTEDRIIENDLTCYARWSLISPPISLDFIQRTVSAGTSQKFTARARLEDGSDRVVAATWQVVGDGSFGSITSNGTFKAAETNAEGSVAVQASYTSRGKTVTSEAKTIWISPRNVTVEFVWDGGTPSVASDTFTVYGMYGTLPSAIRDGYWFDGWFTSSGVDGAKITEDSRVEGGVERLYAHWRKHQAMVLHIDGENTVLAGDSILFAPSVVMDSGETNFVDVVWEIISGSEFVERIDADGVVVASRTPESGEVVITATYEADGKVLSDTKTVYVERKTVLVSFDGNGGEMPDPRTYAVYGPYGNLPYSVRDGYAFGGWWTALGGGLEIGTNSIVEASISSLFAYWLPCWVTFDANGGVGAMTPQSFVLQKTQMLKANAFARSGYVFQGWAASQDGEVIWSDCAQITVEAPITLYSVWKEIYNVSYRLGAYGVGSTRSATKTNNVELVLEGAIFTRTGYTQTGWATSDGGEKAYDLCETYTSEAEVTLYPFWVANTYVITLDRQGGTGGSSSVTVTYGSSMPSIVVPSRAGYSFAGYFTAVDGGGIQYFSSLGAGGRIWKETEAITLYANWVANPAPPTPPPTPVTTTCSVKFNANGGSGGTTKSVTSGKAVGTLPKATRTGYKLKGWYTAKSGGSKITTSTKITKNVTYYAQWTANKYKIKFNKNGGKGTMKTLSATYGKNVRLTANAFKRTGYKFAGWAKKNSKVAYKNKAKVKNLTATNGKTVTLYAAWKKAKSSSVMSAAKSAASATGAWPSASTVSAKSASSLSSLSSVSSHSSSAVPAWTVGTFYGGDEGASTTITVSKAGKVSGKVLFADGSRWTIVGKASGQRIAAVVTDAGGNSAEIAFAIVKMSDGRCRIESAEGSMWAE